MRTDILKKTCVDSENNDVGLKRDFVHVMILLACSLLVGAYLIITTVIIAKDGVYFIEYARNLTVNPVSTMVDQYQHPGYPFLILFAHKITGILYEGTSVFSWIYSAQVVSLIFRLLAIVVMYFIGKILVSPKESFWAMLILIFLPLPAKHGSDALSDWPHMFFLATGYLLLILGAAEKKWWLYGFAGFAAGLGYLIRPECAQIVLFGCLWSAFQICSAKSGTVRAKAVFALILLFIGFIVSAGPYMKLKGAVFPKKQGVPAAQNKPTHQTHEQAKPEYAYGRHALGFANLDIIRSLYKMFQNIGETLMWIYLPAFAIGLYNYFRRQKFCEPGSFFTAALICLNIFILTWLFGKYGYISKRHTMPLVLLTIFHIPSGLRVIASLLGKITNKKGDPIFQRQGNSHLLFPVLIVLGISISMPRLFKPLRFERRNYRQAARWLGNNTGLNDVIAFSDELDKRLPFYAQRRGLKCHDPKNAHGARYMLKKIGHKEAIPSTEEIVFVSDCDKRNRKIFIYQIQN